MPGTAVARRAREALARRGSPALSALARLIENTGASARSASVFGDPVASEGTTVVPVARVTALTVMGGGSSSLFTAVGDGAGGTGFVRVRPAGFLVLDRDGARFQAVRQPATMLAIPLAVVAAAAATRIVGVSVREARRRRNRAVREEVRKAERNG
ncbi:hypothetical protein A6A08_15170 [Nocardiopsis sp. TSRI0078]|uniref:GerW family sporulation protein n=1 Tax=unclassified Nocardiopsis TaxID=2649073 RepID=UPI000938C858|nr:spore germination protein GerW family protein [Nocardiopsis sp. TSRI0078]OKI13624.1 hypothetical protein A6A08_15170 [Nocardiopsis sp. TSRI0078]